MHAYRAFPAYLASIKVSTSYTWDTTGRSRR